jgi:ATP-dependent Clp protease adaptor protein ClpS
LRQQKISKSVKIQIVILFVAPTKDKNALTLHFKFRVMKHGYQEEESVDVLEVIETTDMVDLVVFNDDVNTFDHVISTLIRVCKHTPEQAEQCTLLIHYKGKCAVKNGTFDFLKPMRESICEAGIEARIL